MSTQRKTGKGAPSGAPSTDERSARLRDRIKVYMLARYSRDGLASIIAGFAEIEAMKRRHARHIRVMDERIARLEARSRKIDSSQKRASARVDSAKRQTGATDARVVGALLEILRTWPRRKPCNDTDLRTELVRRFEQSRGVKPSRATLYRAFKRVTAD